MNYVRRSYFKNSRPQNLLPRIPVRREKLLKKMLRNKGAIKYIYAPSGYGKSSLVFDYIDFNHNWQNVFWFNCQSACFKRDVASDELFQLIMQVCDTPNVVVFDDLIDLKGKTKASFTKIVQELIDIDCDIVITQNSILYGAIPFNFDTTFIFGPDLCMSESDAMSAKMYGTYNGFNFENNSLCQCPPCLIFSKTGIEDLLLSPRSSLVSDLEISVLFLIYLFGYDFVDILKRFIDTDELLTVLPIIASKYPHIGIDEEITMFQTVPIDFSLLADVFKPAFENIVKASKFGSVSEFIDEVMDQMCDTDDIKEAFEFVLLFGEEADIKSFATREFASMLKNCEFTLSYKSLQKLENLSIDEDPLVDFYKCCLFAYVRDRDHFSQILSKFGKHEASQKCFYIPCKLMSYVYMFEEYTEDDLKDIIEIASDDAIKDSSYYDGVALQFDIDSCRWLSEFLLRAINDPFNSLKMIGEEILKLDVGNNIDEKSKSLNRYHRNDVAGICLAYAYICLNLINYTKRGQSFRDSFESYFGRENRESALWLFEKISRLFVVLYDEREFARNVPWQLMDALLRMEDVWSVFKDAPDYLDNISIIDVMCTVDSYKDSIEQLNNVISASEKRNIKANNSRQNRISVKKSAANNKVEISIFNKSNLLINSQNIPLTMIANKKGRFMMALLAIGNFSEIHRDTLISDLFPNTRALSRTIMSNFYSIVSTLRKTFEEFGIDDCIIKNSLGYKLNHELVTTDYDGFDILVNDFLFNVGCTDSWEEPYSRLKESYPFPAFDSLTGNKAIDSFRMHSINRLVDSLLSATYRLLEQEDTFGALTLSRQAFELDDKREDVYVALMKAQTHAHQRSQAIETFFECKNFLSKELGIAPSKKLIDEYEKLIV